MYFKTYFLNQSKSPSNHFSEHETLGCESPIQGPICINFRRGGRTSHLLIRTQKVLGMVYT